MAFVIRHWKKTVEELFVIKNIPRPSFSDCIIIFERKFYKYDNHFTIQSNIEVFRLHCIEIILGSLPFQAFQSYLPTFNYFRREILLENEIFYLIRGTTFSFLNKIQLPVFGSLYYSLSIFMSCTINNFSILIKLQWSL